MLNHLAIANNIAAVEAISIASDYDRTVKERLYGKERARAETTLGDGRSAGALLTEFQSTMRRAVVANPKPAATRDPPPKMTRRRPRAPRSEIRVFIGSVVTLQMYARLSENAREALRAVYIERAPIVFHPNGSARQRNIRRNDNDFAAP